MPGHAAQKRLLFESTTFGCGSNRLLNCRRISSSLGRYLHFLHARFL